MKPKISLTPNDIAKIIEDEPGMLIETKCPACGDLRAYVGFTDVKCLNDQALNKATGEIGKCYFYDEEYRQKNIEPDEAQRISGSIRDQIVEKLIRQKKGTWYIEPWDSSLEKYLLSSPPHKEPAYTIHVSVSEDDNINLTIYDYIDNPIDLNQPGTIVSTPDIERLDIYSSKDINKISNMCDRVAEDLIRMYESEHVW